MIIPQHLYTPIISGNTAIIVLRIWYLYSNQLSGRLIVVAAFAACTISVFALLGTDWHELVPIPLNIPGVSLPTCPSPFPKHLWKIWVPSLIFHTLMFIATTYQAMRVRQLGGSSQLMDRILRE